MKNKTNENKRGVKQGTKRGAYDKKISPREIFSIRLSREEREQIDAMRGDLNVADFIRLKLGLKKNQKKVKL